MIYQLNIILSIPVVILTLLNYSYNLPTTQDKIQPIKNPTPSLPIKENTPLSEKKKTDSTKGISSSTGNNVTKNESNGEANSPRIFDESKYIPQKEKSPEKITRNVYYRDDEPIDLLADLGKKTGNSPVSQKFGKKREENLLPTTSDNYTDNDKNGASYSPRSDDGTKDTSHMANLPISFITKMFSRDDGIDFPENEEKKTSNSPINQKSGNKQAKNLLPTTSDNYTDNDKKGESYSPQSDDRTKYTSQKDNPPTTLNSLPSKSDNNTDNENNGKSYSPRPADGANYPSQKENPPSKLNLLPSTNDNYTDNEKNGASYSPRSDDRTKYTSQKDSPPNRLDPFRSTAENNTDNKNNLKSNSLPIIHVPRIASQTENPHTKLDTLTNTTKTFTGNEDNNKSYSPGSSDEPKYNSQTESPRANRTLHLYYRVDDSINSLKNKEKKASNFPINEELRTTESRDPLRSAGDNNTDNKNNEKSNSQQKIHEPRSSSQTEIPPKKLDTLSDKIKNATGNEDNNKSYSPGSSDEPKYNSQTESPRANRTLHLYYRVDDSINSLKNKEKKASNFPINEELRTTETRDPLRSAGDNNTDNKNNEKSNSQQKIHEPRSSSQTENPPKKLDPFRSTAENNTDNKNNLKSNSLPIIHVPRIASQTENPHTKLDTLTNTIKRFTGKEDSNKSYSPGSSDEPKYTAQEENPRANRDPLRSTAEYNTDNKNNVKSNSLPIIQVPRIGTQTENPPTKLDTLTNTIKRFTGKEDSNKSYSPGSSDEPKYTAQEENPRANRDPLRSTAEYNTDNKNNVKSNSLPIIHVPRIDSPTENPPTKLDTLSNTKKNVTGNEDNNKSHSPRSSNEPKYTAQEEHPRANRTLNMCYRVDDSLYSPENKERKSSNFPINQTLRTTETQEPLRSTADNNTDNKNNGKSDSIQTIHVPTIDSWLRNLPTKLDTLSNTKKNVTGNEDNNKSHSPRSSNEPKYTAQEENPRANRTLNMCYRVDDSLYSPENKERKSSNFPINQTLRTTETQDLLRSTAENNTDNKNNVKSNSLPIIHVPRIGSQTENPPTKLDPLRSTAENNTDNKSNGKSNSLQTIHVPRISSWLQNLPTKLDTLSNTKKNVTGNEDNNKSHSPRSSNEPKYTAQEENPRANRTLNMCYRVDDSLYSPENKERKSSNFPINQTLRTTETQDPLRSTAEYNTDNKNNVKSNSLPIIHVPRIGSQTENPPTKLDTLTNTIKRFTGNEDSNKSYSPGSSDEPKYTSQRENPRANRDPLRSTAEYNTDIKNYVKSNSLPVIHVPRIGSQTENPPTKLDTLSNTKKNVTGNEDNNKSHSPRSSNEPKYTAQEENPRANRGDDSLYSPENKERKSSNFPTNQTLRTTETQDPLRSTAEYNTDNKNNVKSNSLPIIHVPRIGSQTENPPTKLDPLRSTAENNTDNKSKGKSNSLQTIHVPRISSWLQNLPPKLDTLSNTKKNVTGNEDNNKSHSPRSSNEPKYTAQEENPRANRTLNMCYRVDDSLYSPENKERKSSNFPINQTLRTTETQDPLRSTAEYNTDNKNNVKSNSLPIIHVPRIGSQTKNPPTKLDTNTIKRFTGKEDSNKSYSPGSSDEPKYTSQRENPRTNRDPLRSTAEYNTDNKNNVKSNSLPIIHVPRIDSPTENPPTKLEPLRSTAENNTDNKSNGKSNSLQTIHVPRISSWLQNLPTKLDTLSNTKKNVTGNEDNNKSHSPRSSNEPKYTAQEENPRANRTLNMCYRVDDSLYSPENKERKSSNFPINQTLRTTETQDPLRSTADNNTDNKNNGKSDSIQTMHVPTIDSWLRNLPTKLDTLSNTKKNVTGNEDNNKSHSPRSSNEPKYTAQEENPRANRTLNVCYRVDDSLYSPENKERKSSNFPINQTLRTTETQDPLRSTADNNTDNKNNGKSDSIQTIHVPKIDSWLRNLPTKLDKFSNTKKNVTGNVDNDKSYSPGSSDERKYTSQKENPPAKYSTKLFNRDTFSPIQQKPHK
ncbi:uncharacterized protein LOC142332632 isoform X8 [Lycorma delicatula]|uniref:uncharacterized protein LOC142332632 isoform X8 n=1 Tax=Lycorma delicatula TaxID=130591 RepID=UPI003F513FC7